MVVDGKDGKKDIEPVNGPNKPTPLEEDLDKNPIKYATSEPGVMTTEPHDKAYMEMTLRAGQHGDMMQKLLRQRIELRAKEFPRWPGDPAGGVRTMWIESRFWYDRERLGPDFDDDWRLYRAKYLKSLELDPREPVLVPEYERELINPIRRFYMRGGDWLQKNVYEKVSNNRVRIAIFRNVSFKFAMLYLGGLGVYYWLRYNGRTWEKQDGPQISVSAPVMYPSHPKWPFKNPRTEPAHHYLQNFDNRTAFRDLRNYEDTTVPL